MPETDEYADEQPEPVVRKVADPQADSENPAQNADGEDSGPRAQTRSGSMMIQGQM
ncbi:hypothetical protein [Kitasatospora purpeofusca]|uniref:Uncharacterized protein n=1 Tax=Kitasatospora purpeofusca TaxID=67352 RepID=A0ABZ1UBA3_9ACTN|nr:hypothetical protein [Kitasatospora purpeofusca]